jgi:curved DNA-binding protein CbpA
MTFPRLEDMDFYDLLGVDRTAAPEDVLRAYLDALATYQDGSLASYSLLTDEERRAMMGRLDEAYETLRDPDRRAAYDESLGCGRPAGGAGFRRSTSRLEIQDAARPEGWAERLKARLGLRAKARRNGESPPPAAGPSGFLPRGDQLRALRLRRGLSAEAAARGLRLSQATFTALEDGNPLPANADRAALLKAYARVLGLGA